MSSKRGAISDLNHDNWNEEYEPEEAGEFKKANEDEIKKRIIRTAKRRNPVGTSNGDGEVKKSVFSGFSGFGSTGGASTATTNSPFAFLSKIATPSNGPSKDPAPVIAVTAPIANVVGSTTEKSGEYGSKIRKLNESISSWIKQHVDKQPFCILTPIFADYEKHLKTIETEEAATAKESPKTPPQSANLGSFVTKPAEKTETTSNFKFGSPSAAPTTTSPPASTFSFGSSANKPMFGSGTSPIAPLQAKSTFDFGSLGKPAVVPSSTTLKADDKPVFGGFGGFGGAPAASTSSSFSFGLTPSFSFGSGAVTQASKPTEDTKADEDEEPPKNEFVPVVEENIFSKRCKVFVKSGADYSDRGIGTLYLKKIEETGKVQLLVRADTNLGNILLNIILSEAIPAS